MKSDPLPYMKKRHLLNEPEVDAQRMKRLGDRYLEESLLHDAILFYEKAKDFSGIETILTKALDEGDVFLAKQALKLLGKELSKEEWIRLARVAEEKGKFFFAVEAYREAGEEGEAGRLNVTTAALLNEPAQSLDMPESGV